MTHELNLVIDGSEWTRLDDGRSSTHAKGSVMLVPAGRVHSSGTGRAGAKYSCVHIVAAHAQVVADELCRGLFQRPLFFTAPQAIRAAFVAFENSTPGALERDGLSLALLRAFAEVVGLKRRRVIPGRGRSLALVEDAMRASPETNFALNDLAALAGLTPWHFVSAFRRAYGVTPHRRLIELRLEKAQRLMADPERSLTDIAYDVGFGSSSRLSDAFRKYLKTTPSAWRCVSMSR